VTASQRLSDSRPAKPGAVQLNALGIFDYIADQSLVYAEAVCERILARPLRSFTLVPKIIPMCYSGMDRIV
jgi:hypothetical protein